MFLSILLGNEEAIKIEFLLDFQFYAKFNLNLIRVNTQNFISNDIPLEMYLWDTGFQFVG